MLSSADLCIEHVVIDMLARACQKQPEYLSARPRRGELDIDVIADQLAAEIHITRGERRVSPEICGQ